MRRARELAFGWDMLGYVRMDGKWMEKEKVKTRDCFWLIHLPRGLGKFTKTGKFRLHITALNVIAPHARYKVRPGGEGGHPHAGDAIFG